MENWSKVPDAQESAETMRVFARAQDVAEHIVFALEDLRLSALEQVREAAARDTRALGLLFARILDGVTGGPFGLEAAHAEAGLVLESTLNDFTEADLTRAEFIDADLTGVRWTLQGTQWPDHFDIDELLYRSVEEPYAAGIYRVQSGGDYTRLYDLVPVSA
ncbi:pentapeptide repeat-containing protein [Actinacidiphila alni]|uniref:pentapeptide repeat-containing protein n=1 Tax=Actinacidiphila alni TaxID=380248 RepID=UPI000D1B6D40|nr:pentapeptide repeat-containing protein [Actinacidiphila alni]